MSLKASMRVWKEKLSGSKKLVKLCLADFANDQWQCWPSLSTIAERTGLSRRYTIALLGELESDGEIRRAQRGTTSTLYTLLFQSSEPASEAGDTSASEAESTSSEAGDTTLVMQTSLGSEAGDTSASEAGSTKVVRPASPEQSFNSQFKQSEEQEREKEAEAAKSLAPNKGLKQGDLRLEGQGVYPEWPLIPDARTAERIFQQVSGMVTFPGKSRPKDIERICALYDRHKAGTVEYIRPYFEAWLKRGYYKGNTDWLDWAITEKLPEQRGGNGKVKSTAPPPECADATVQSALEYLRMNPKGALRDGALKRMKERGYGYDDGKLIKLESAGAASRAGSEDQSSQ